MRPVWIALGAVTLLGACSSSGTSPVFTAIKSVVLPSKEDTAPTGPRLEVTRERIVQNGLAMVRARIEGEEISNILSATSLNGNYVTYVSGFRQSITMLGTLVTATRGLGGDLLSVRNAPDDPVATPTKPADWPTRITRDYRFPGVGPAGTVVSVSCDLVPSAPTSITIVEITYNVTPFTETCAGDGVSFTNTYLADKTGQIWQTRQWVGDKVGYLNLEVLEPFTVD